MYSKIDPLLLPIARSYKGNVMKEIAIYLGGGIG